MQLAASPGCAVDGAGDGAAVGGGGKLDGGGGSGLPVESTVAPAGGSDLLQRNKSHLPGYVSMSHPYRPDIAPALLGPVRGKAAQVASTQEKRKPSLRVELRRRASEGDNVALTRGGIRRSVLCLDARL